MLWASGGAFKEGALLALGALQADFGVLAIGTRPVHAALFAALLTGEKGCLAAIS